MNLRNRVVRLISIYQKRHKGKGKPDDGERGVLMAKFIQLLDPETRKSVLYRLEDIMGDYDAGPYTGPDINLLDLDLSPEMMAEVEAAAWAAANSV